MEIATVSCIKIDTKTVFQCIFFLLLLKRYEISINDINPIKPLINVMIERSTI